MHILGFQKRGLLLKTQAGLYQCMVNCSRVTLELFFWKTKQLYMHGTLASIEKAAECCPRAFLLSSSSSFELHAVLTL